MGYLYLLLSVRVNTPHILGARHVAGLKFYYRMSIEFPYNYGLAVLRKELKQ